MKPVANIVTKNTEKFWAEKVRDLSRNALVKYVKELRKQGDLQNQDTKIKDKAAAKELQDLIARLNENSNPVLMIVELK